MKWLKILIYKFKKNSWVPINMLNIDLVLNKGFKTLSNSSIKTPKLDAQILLSHVLKKNLKEIILNCKIKPNETEMKRYKELIQRRKSGEPIAYIVKKKEFWKYNFYVDQNVLIPRPDTEVIIEETLKLINVNQNKLILDIGTGSGCIILSLIKERPKLRGNAIDVSKNALKVAKINAKMHQLINRIKFYNSSVDNFFKGKYDLIVSNPPYIINSKIKYLDRDITCYEPLVSLKGGPDGSCVLKQVIKKSSSLIKIGGKLVLEIGYDQKYIVMNLLKKENFYINKIIKDYAKNDRCIIATKI